MATRSFSRRVVLASAVAGLFAAGVLPATSARAEEADLVHCYGINACKGKGTCGGKGHSCAGQNECAGKGYLQLPKETCLSIKGGRLTPQGQSDDKKS